MIDSSELRSKIMNSSEILNEFNNFITSERISFNIKDCIVCVVDIIG